MADVKTVDIDGSQWGMKDQIARDRITTLETKTTIKITKKIDKVDIKMNLVEINDEKFIQLHFDALKWSGVIGETIATFVQDFNLPIVLRCSIGMDFEDYTGRYNAGLDIQQNGEIKIYPYVQDKMDGTFKAARLYGDAFIRVQY